MRSQPVLLMAVLLTVGLSCTSKKAREDNPLALKVENLHTEVMALHDSVMPETEHILSEKARLRKLSDDLDSAFLAERIKQLDEADESMMQWMRGFNPQMYEGDTTALIEYYEDQKLKMQEIQIIIEDALTASTQIQPSDSM